MQCHCGAEATTKYAQRKVPGDRLPGYKDSRLTFNECRACGRIGNATLIIDGIVVADERVGDDARGSFNSLTPESAESLFAKGEEAILLATTEREQAEQADNRLEPDYVEEQKAFDF